MLTRIKRARLLKGLQQKELADMLGVTQASVSQWENGRSSPSVKRMKHVAEALGTTVEELLKNPEGKEVS